MSGAEPTIRVVGAGITGLWQALLLARAGYGVQLVERSDEGAPFLAGASRFAGAMLAPDCEAEAAPRLVRDLGRGAVATWRAVYPALSERGSLVVAGVRDRGDLARFGAMTERHQTLGRTALAALEPSLAGNFDCALYFSEEAHMAAPDALVALLESVRAAGVRVRFGCDGFGSGGDLGPADLVIDARGFEAAPDIARLRGVRGERAIVRAREVKLTRPVRLLHPRVPLYIVPWPDARFMIGATVIESEESGPMTVRSALELLGAATAVHPGFAEAEILDLGAGVRPALADNIPRAMVDADGRTIRVNGAYRHGFLLAPVLAEAVIQYLAGGPAADHPLLVRERG